MAVSVKFEPIIFPVSSSSLPLSLFLLPSFLPPWLLFCLCTLRWIFDIFLFWRSLSLFFSFSSSSSFFKVFEMEIPHAAQAGLRLASNFLCSQGLFGAIGPPPHGPAPPSLAVCPTSIWLPFLLYSCFPLGSLGCNFLSCHGPGKMKEASNVLARLIAVLSETGKVRC